VNSGTFARPYFNTANYYFHAIQTTIYTAGIYIFSSSSSIDTFGYLYESSFNPSYPSDNMITYDNDGAGDQQFQISRYLQSGRIYILVVTTYSSGTTGSFSIRATGPASLDLTAFTQATSE
jgi:hypothetical protein